MANNTRTMEQRLSRFMDISILSGRPFDSIDALRFLLGDKIAEGQYRAVFDFDFIKGTVIKVCVKEARANVLEMLIWKDVKDIPSLSKWFAPCLHMSPEGTYMVQKKTRPVTDKDKLPKRIPFLFTDVKKENWGFIGNRLVCHDYQFMIRAIDAAFNSKMQIANWK